MRLILPIAFAILISACETTPPELAHTFEEFEAVSEDVKAVWPNELPKIKSLECYPSNEDCKIAGYTDMADIDTFETFKELAIGNTEIADNSADAIDDLLERDEAMLAAAKQQEQITNLREEQLAYVRQLQRQEKWYYRGMLALIGAAAFLAAGN